MISDNFLSRFRKALEMWGRDSFADAYLERVYERTRDLTDSEMRDLCDVLIDHCERVPSVFKVISYAGVVRSKRIEKKENDSSLESLTRCYECNDLGVLRVEGEKGDLLMRCTNHKCVPSYYWELPRFSRFFEPEFRKSKCPVEWFKPNEGESRKDKIEEWKSKIKISQIRFQEIGIAPEILTEEKRFT